MIICSKLPHLYSGHTSFFITFRLADSLPQAKVFELKTMMAREIQSIGEKDPYKRSQIIEELTNKYFGKFEKQLNGQPFGSCILKEEKVAGILYDKILSYDQVFYDLKCLSIMPNHVHLLIATLVAGEEKDLGKWLQLIKGGSSYLINKHLGKSGVLWASESFDRFIRNEDHYRFAFNYTINNSIVAGLGEKYGRKPFLYRCDE
ncbi:MAG: transposase [Saprospiraceae bacterium]|nr:transposase [Saprospiraceae bacterium]MBP7641939.1 transposase [Saprospiraceae bacterium]HMS67241.1 hypothetical protein [Saprospiraceae bacterium]